MTDNYSGQYKAALPDEAPCGPTHYAGCACHEAKRNARIRSLEAEVERLVKRLGDDHFDRLVVVHRSCQELRQQCRLAFMEAYEGLKDEYRQPLIEAEDRAAALEKERDTLMQEMSIGNARCHTFLIERNELQAWKDAVLAQPIVRTGLAATIDPYFTRNVPLIERPKE